MSDIASFHRRLFEELDRIVACLKDMSPEQLDWVPPAEGANSLRAIASHAIGAAEVHVVARLAKQDVARDRAAEFAVRGGDGTGLIERYAAVRERIGSALGEVDPVILDEDRSTSWGAFVGRDWLIHATCHAAEHAGQAELTRDMAKALERHVADVAPPDR